MASNVVMSLLEIVKDRVDPKTERFLSLSDKTFPEKLHDGSSLKREVMITIMLNNYKKSSEVIEHYERIIRLKECATNGLGAQESVDQAEVNAFCKEVEFANAALNYLRPLRKISLYHSP